jgi:hypothetical protein
MSYSVTFADGSSPADLSDERSGAGLNAEGLFRFVDFAITTPSQTRDSR